MEDLGLKELTNDELMTTDGGVAAAAIAIGLLGFGTGVVIGAAAAYGIYCLIKYLAE